MATRRDVIMGGTAILTLTANALRLANASVPSDADHFPKPRTLYKIVFDQRQPMAQSFARRAEAAGQTIYGLADDPASLWYDDLYHLWRNTPLAIAGMTTEHVALCLQLYAQDAGLRPVYRGKHWLGQDGVAEHRFYWSAPVTPARLNDSHDWSADVVRVIGTGDAVSSLRREFAVRGGDAAGLRSDQYLISWLFAPIGRA